MHEDRDFHVVIVGGGVIGSAVACFTLQETSFRGRVTVIERDPSYARASSALSASSIRQQFGTAINVAISRYGIAFLREAAERLAVDGNRPALGLVEPGYLYLAATDDGAGTLRSNHRVQLAQGADIALLEPDSAPGALSLARRRRRETRCTGHERRRLVRRLQPAAGVPRQGAFAGRELRRRRSVRFRPHGGTDRRGRAHRWLANRGRRVRQRGRAVGRRGGALGRRRPARARAAPFGVRVHLPHVAARLSPGDRPFRPLVSSRGPRAVHLRHLARRVERPGRRAARRSSTRCSTTCSGRCWPLAFPPSRHCA